MRPIAETSEAIERLSADTSDQTMLKGLMDAGAKVRRIVPDCMGLSLAYPEEGVTFTLVASDAQIRVLDAVQYIDGGPCVDAATEGESVMTDEERLLDEERWRSFARASAAAGVSSTLSLPIRRGSRVIGGVNLYGASPNAFAGHHDELAHALGAWAEGAVINADLSFSTRAEAMEAPARLDHSSDIHVATGIIAASRGISTEDARGELRQAAERAGAEEWELAGQVRKLHGL